MEFLEAREELAAAFEPAVLSLDGPHRCSGGRPRRSPPFWRIRAWQPGLVTACASPPTARGENPSFSHARKERDPKEPTKPLLGQRLPLTPSAQDGHDGREHSASVVDGLASGPRLALAPPLTTDSLRSQQRPPPQTTSETSQDLARIMQTLLGTGFRCRGLHTKAKKRRPRAAKAARGYSCGSTPSQCMSAVTASPAPDRGS